MALSKDDVHKIAHLARISIDEATEKTLLPQLQSILKMVDQMNAVDTSDIETMSHPLDATQRLRCDEVGSKNRREVLQANAPAIEDGLFLVPKVMD